MWHDDTIYFGSDRGPEHRINLYSYSLKTKQTKQLTDFKDYDVDWPSLGPDAIVFSNGGYLYTFDLKSQKAKKLTVYLPGDRDLARPHWANVARFVTDFDISPEGNRAVLTARGDIFTVPAKEGSIRNLTQTPGIREKYAAWSPDGKWIAYLSDRTRRRGDLHHAARRHGQGDAHHHRRQDVPHASRLVARQQEAALCRQRPAPVLCRY